MAKDHIAIWNKCLRHIKTHVGEQSYKTWFEPIIPYRYAEDTLTIQVPSQFFYEWLEEHYLNILKQVISTELGPQGKLAYSIIIDKSNTKKHRGAPMPPQVNPYNISIPQPATGYPPSSNTAFPPTSPPAASFNMPPAFQAAPANHVTPSAGKTNPFSLNSIGNEERKSHLNPNYCFENFIAGDCNQLAKSAAEAVAKRPGETSFNPLMVYGGVGLGKTHIVQALGNEVQNNYPDKFVLYVSSEKFTIQFIEALRNNDIQSFINFYFQVDVLIIDDIQFLSGKEKTQEVFFHIFNHLHQYKKQIIMTSDCPPRTLKGLQERLLSRFKWGLTADLQRPSFETRVAILQSKLESEGIYIPSDLQQYIAHSVDTNIRELEGVLISLMARSSLNKREIDLELAKEVLKNIVREIETEVNVDYIQKVVAEYFGISFDLLKGKSRKKEVAIARQVAMYLAKEYTDHSLKSIGGYFGGRDHSTVIHAIQVVNDTLDIDKNFRNRLEGLKQNIKLSAAIVD